MARLRPALADAACAICFGIAAGAIGAAGAKVESVITGIGAARLITATAAGIGAILAGTVTARGIRDLRIGVGAGLAGAVALVAKVGIKAGLMAGLEAGSRVGIVLGAGIAAGIGIDWMIDHIGADEISRENIGFGMCLGGTAAILGAGFADIVPTIAASSLVGGIAAGILSLIRR